MRAAAAVSLALVTLALTLLCLPAAAQLPPAPSVGVTADFTAGHGTVSVEAPQTFELVVRNTSPATGTPMDEQNLGHVEVVLSGAPADWIASVEPASFDLMPGAERTVQVEVLASAEGADSGRLTATVTLTSPLDPLDPILGNIPGGNQTATATDTIDLSRSESASRDVLEAIGKWIWIVLFALVAAVVVAARFALVGRRPGVALESPDRGATIAPGGRASVPITVRNVSRKANTATFEVSSVPQGWAAFLPVADLQLPPEARQEMNLIVIAPANATEGERQTILVLAQTPASRRPASLPVEVVVERGGVRRK